MYVTSIEFSVAPFSKRFPRPLRWTLHQVASLGFTDAADLASYVQFLDEKPQVQVDWSSFEHHESTHEGSVEMTVQWRDSPARPSTMSWDYEPLDDPDNAVPLEIPVDFRTDVVGALTMDQRLRFWGRVNPDLDPFLVLDAILERFGLVPTEHDAADLYTMRTVLALEWYRNFPTLEAGEATLDLEPDLTDEVLGALSLMASRCALEGEGYELFDIFVASRP